MLWVTAETQDPDVKGYALDIKSASKTLLSLVNGVLDFSKIESGKMGSFVESSEE